MKLYCMKRSDLGERRAFTPGRNQVSKLTKIEKREEYKNYKNKNKPLLIKLIHPSFITRIIYNFNFIVIIKENVKQYLDYSLQEILLLTDHYFN
jgi:hypothetical protein